MSLPKRKEIRLKNHDYNEPGAYFITICTKDRHHILWRKPVGTTSGRPSHHTCPHTNGDLYQDNHPEKRKTVHGPGLAVKSPPLSKIGEIVDSEINKIHSIYDTVKIDKYVIMPNHIHMIISLHTPIKNVRTTFGRPLPNDPPENIHPEPQYNPPNPAPTISRIIQQFKGSISKQVGFPIWQKRFHDHIIRNEDQFWKIWEYIDTNPAKWHDDCFYDCDTE